MKKYSYRDKVWREMKTPGKKSRPLKPVWVLDRDGITYSGLTLFGNCPEQFWLKYVEGWSKTGFSVALEFGSAFHFLLERYPYDDPPEQIRSWARAQTMAYASSVTDITNRTEEISRCFGMVPVVFDYYIRYWRSYDKKHGLEWIGREDKFHCQNDNTLNLPTRGMIDGKLRSKYGKKYLFETKTKALIDGQALADSVARNAQPIFYSNAFFQQEGHWPDGLIYNVIRRPGLRQSKKESVNAYLDRVDEDVEKRPDHYFHRWEVSYLPEDFPVLYERTIQPQLLRMKNWWQEMLEIGAVIPLKTTYNLDPSLRWKNQHHYENPENHLTKYGRCDVFDILNKGDYSQHSQRTIAHPELGEN